MKYKICDKTVSNANVEIKKPYLLSSSTTQTTISIRIANKCSGYTYYYSGPILGDEFTISNLYPEQSLSVSVRIEVDDYYMNIKNNFSTKSLSLNVREISNTASSIQADASYTKDDAVITSEKIILGDKWIAGNSLNVKGLNPNTSYAVKYLVTISYGENNRYSREYEVTKNIKTAPLSLSTLGPKVVSLGNVIVAAEANVDDEEENVGFEWRRTDWTDDFASNTGIAYLYEGTMEGYIRNLNTDKLWKYRPFYLADSGTYYYGDWMGLDPTNTSYFDPTVHTYAKIEIIGNTALVKGYALNGTDKIVVQGFKYWKKANKANSVSMGMAKAPTIPANAMTTEADGRVMEATLSGLDYETDYDYVAFVKTTEGETFYGDVRSFTTGENTTGISDMTHSDGTSTGDVREVARYNLRGQRIDTPERGVNIIRYSDGTTRKVVVK